VLDKMRTSGHINYLDLVVVGRSPSSLHSSTSRRTEGFQNLSLRPLKSSKVVRQTPYELRVNAVPL